MSILEMEKTKVEPETPAQAVPDVYLLVDELLADNGVIDRRSVKVTMSGDAHASSHAVETLKPFVDMAENARMVLDKSISGTKTDPDQEERVPENLVFTPTRPDRHRHAGYAAKLLTNSGVDVHIRHEVRTGPFRSEKVVRTRRPELFAKVTDMMPGVEEGISARLVTSIPNEQTRGRVAAGLTEVAIGAAARRR